MARPKLISLSRLWYTLLVVGIHLILLYFGFKQLDFHDRLSSLQWESVVQRTCLVLSSVLLVFFIYPSLFHIGNFSNDDRQLTLKDLKTGESASMKDLWHHWCSLSASLHLMMSFFILISPLLIQSKQMLISTNTEPGFLRRTDLDLLFDWSTPSSVKYVSTANVTSTILLYPPMNYSRWCLLNFLFASLVCVLREPNVFWSVSKIFSLLYSIALALNVIQWSLMYGAVQLLLKNLCFNPIDARYNIGYLLSNQPYTTFTLYLLLEFLVYMSSMTFYYYAYVRFQQHEKSSCYDRCSNYCPSLVAIIILLLYTACKMPLVHDIFLLFIQTRIRLLFIAFIFEICHVLILLTLWIFLTAKVNWRTRTDPKLRVKVPCGVVVKNTPLQPIATTTLSLPDLNRESSSNEKPYEKIRIFQSEIYYRNRPKNWSLPLNQQASMMAAFDADDDIVLRSPSTSNKNEVHYRDAVRKTVPNIYQTPSNQSREQPKAVFLRGNTPPTPPVKRFKKEQVEAARKRAEQMFSSQKRTADYTPHRHSAALLISQV